MNEEYQKLIDVHDQTLSLLRDSWMAAQPEDKDKWLKALDSALEERFRLMELRDKCINPIAG